MPQKQLLTISADTPAHKAVDKVLESLAGSTLADKYPSLVTDLREYREDMARDILFVLGFKVEEGGLYK